MADIYDEINDLEFEVVTMTDENGDAVEFSIIDNVACGGERYLLVVETELMDDDETDAIILKEVSINTDDVPLLLRWFSLYSRCFFIMCGRSCLHSVLRCCFRSR